VALVGGMEGAIIGLIVSASILVLGMLTRSGDRAPVAASAPSA
jgi:hypothetical protein